MDAVVLSPLPFVERVGAWPPLRWHGYLYGGEGRVLALRFPTLAVTPAKAGVQ